MKVQIIKSSSRNFWYAHRIGEIIKVESLDPERGYYTSRDNMKTNDPEYVAGYIREEDCKLVEN